jgi:hypothetical protein
MKPYHEIMSDGRTVWVNDAFCNVGRFSRTGVDIHKTADEQMKTGTQCLDCKAGSTTRADWEHFKSTMLRIYGADIEDKYMPEFLRDT